MNRYENDIQTLIEINDQECEVLEELMEQNEPSPALAALYRGNGEIAWILQEMHQKAKYHPRRACGHK